MPESTALLILASYAFVWLALALYAAGMARGAHPDRPGPSPGHGKGLGRLATLAVGTSWIGLTAGLLARGMASGHWPLSNRYEFALCFAWAILGIYLLLELRWHQRTAGAFTMTAGLLVMTFALLRPEDEKALHPLLPALRSIWLQFHVIAAAVGYGACGVAAGLAAAELAGVESEDVERQAQRVIGWGFPWLTAALLTGAIWAQDAWGRYWGWDPKETWTLIVWLWYLLLLHSRELKGWRGRRLAWLTIAGFGIVLFAFAGLPWLLRTVRIASLHSF